MNTKYDNFKFRNAYVGDVEVYRDYFLLVLADVNKNLENGDVTEDTFDVIMIDSRQQGFESVIREHLKDSLFIGFNNKAYDNKILRYIAGTNAQHTEVKTCNLSVLKEYSDSIIENRELSNYNKMFFYSLDVRDECRINANISLKDVEYHFNLDVITEDDSFDIEVSHNEEKLDEIRKYCKHDVFTTYLIVRESLSNRKGLATFENKLKSADIMINQMRKRGERVENDGLKRAVLSKPATIAAKMFERKEDGEYQRWYEINDKPEITEPRTEIARRIYERRKADIHAPVENFMLGDVLINFGSGGLHTVNTEDSSLELYRDVYNFDVASFYPSFIEKFDRIANFDIELFRYLKAERLRLKRMKDDVDAQARQNAYKLMINSTTGKYNESYWNNGTSDNPIYNPHVYYSMTTSCQLMLLDLAESLFEYVNIVQLNTDGIAFTLKGKGDIEKARGICREWEQYFGYELEESHFDLFVQRSVNDYIGIERTGDKVKAKSKGSSFAELKGISASADMISNVLANVFKRYDCDSLDYGKLSDLIDSTVDGFVESKDHNALQINIKAVSTVKDKNIYDRHGNVTGTRTKGMRAFIVNDGDDTVRIKANQYTLNPNYIHTVKATGRQRLRNVKLGDLEGCVPLMIHNRRVEDSENIDYNTNIYKFLCKRELLKMMNIKALVTEKDGAWEIEPYYD